MLKISVILTSLKSYSS